MRLVTSGPPKRDVRRAVLLRREKKEPTPKVTGEVIELTTEAGSRRHRESMIQWC